MKRSLFATIVLVATIMSALAFGAPADALETRCEPAPSQIRFADGVLLTVIPGDSGVNPDNGTVGQDLIERASMANDEVLSGNALLNVNAAREFVEQLAASERTPCAQATAYPGPFTNLPASPTKAFGFGGAVIEPIILDLESGDGEIIEAAANDLAHSGSESFVLAYFGAGLVAFGAGALGMRRRMVIQQGH